MIEALRPFLWSSASVEPSLHCVLRLLRGCYHHPQPFWTAADRFSPGLRDLTGGVAVSGARLAQLSSAASVYLGRYAAVMYPGLGPDSNLVRLAHLQGALFPGWRAEGTSAVARLVQEAADQTMGGLLRMVGIGQVRELPHAHQLVDVLAEIVVCLAAHALQWTVEQVIIPFLKFRKRSNSTAAYALVAMRSLALMLDPSSEFTSVNSRMQREVPMLLAPAIDQVLTTAYSQCGIQRLGIRYYPLPVDTFDGRPVSEAIARLSTATARDFGPHPLGDTDTRRQMDVRSAISVSASATAAAKVTPQDEADRENEWRKLGLVRLEAYKGGGILGGDSVGRRE